MIIPNTNFCKILQNYIRYQTIRIFSEFFWKYSEKIRRLFLSLQANQNYMYGKDRIQTFKEDSHRLRQK